MAFQQKSDVGIIFTFNNFINFFKELQLEDSLFKSGITNTFLCFGFNIGRLFLAILVTYFLYKKIWGHGIFSVLFYLPVIITATVTTSLVKYSLATDGPYAILLNKLFEFKIPALFSESRYAMKTILLIDTFYSIGGNMILISGAMNGIDKDVLEAGKIDGVGWFRELVQIIFPLIWPTFSVMFIIILTGMFMSSGSILLYIDQNKYRSTSTYTINFWIFQQVLDKGDYYLASAVGLIFSVLTLPFVFLFRWSMDKISDKIGV